MYNVAQKFHQLAIQPSSKTRCRIYFIPDTVDCTDDNDVITNGTLLVRDNTDTDSGRRISGDTGVIFSNYFNPDKNIQIGACVSSEVSMTLLNLDGALDNFTFGRCKIYLDVYDEENLTWLNCPMGVYLIEQPIGTVGKKIDVHGFDQMQLLDTEATWWNPNHWSVGSGTLTSMLNIFAYATGVPVKTESWMNDIYCSYSPFRKSNPTNREILEKVAEYAGAMAYFDRDGQLTMRWFTNAVVSEIGLVTIDTDQIGNQCLSVDIANYSVEKFGKLTVKIGTIASVITKSSVEYPNPKNEYWIYNNSFFDPFQIVPTEGDLYPGFQNAYIMNELWGITPYTPIQAKLVWDWSIDAGDIVQIKRNNVTYKFPIFQVIMTWRGGYVVADASNDGDVVNPYTDSQNEQAKDAISPFIVNGGAGTVNTDLTFYPGENALVVISGAASVRTAAFIVHCEPDGTILKRDISSGSAYSYVTSTPYTVTINNSSHVNNSGLRISF